MRPTPCDPAELPALLPRALAGDLVLAPVDPASAAPTLRMLRPDEPVTEPDAALIVATSGSTGTPKGVVLSRRALVAAAESAQRVTGPLAWTLALPPHYVAGAMVVVRSTVAGTPMSVVSSDLSDLVAPDLPSAISIVPTQLHRALASERITAALRAHDLVLLGGAAPPPGLIDRAARAGVRVVTTYGMSETCGGCVWDGRPLPGVEVELGASGRISLHGDMAFSGYRLRPDLTADTLVDDRTVLTRDRGEWSDGLLHLLGRLDDVVISGGVNVDLSALERAASRLTGHPVAAIGVPDDEWGTRVVLASTDPRDLDAWRDDLRGHLLAAALPRQLLRPAALPRTSSGKIDRRALMEWAGEGERESRGHSQ
ncbi:MAG: AMP-binding protein [Propionibacterium sp.]|nr:AMP-binding protein [Propionibacterium sp.]